MEEDGNNFDAWLNEVVIKFRDLTDDQRNETLDSLFRNCGGRQFYYISQRLTDMLYIDFIRLLPIEISHKILEYLDAKTLLACCSVSHTWYDIVNNFEELWYQLCSDIGVNIKDVQQEMDDEDIGYKAVYQSQKNRLCMMKKGIAFQASYLEGHEGVVTALYYKNGRLATGSVDHSVRLWNTESRECLLEIKTGNSVSAVKFDDDLIVVGSFLGMIVCWNIHKRTLVKEYISHANGVPGVDFDQELDILVSASYDTYIKIWQLSTGELLKSIRQEIAPFPIFRPIVRLMHNKINEKDNRCQYTVLACYSGRGGLHTYSDLRCSLFRISENHEVIPYDISSEEAPRMALPRYELPYMVDMLRYRSMENDLALDQDLPSKGRLRSMPLHEHEIAFLIEMPSYGDRYCVFINTARATVYIYDRKTMDIVAEKCLHNCGIVGHGLAMIGDREWLDGMSNINCKGLLMAVAKENNVLLLHWSSMDPKTCELNSLDKYFEERSLLRGDI